jgi:hypothetical protein
MRSSPGEKAIRREVTGAECASRDYRADIQATQVISGIRWNTAELSFL